MGSPSKCTGMNGNDGPDLTVFRRGVLLAVVFLVGGRRVTRGDLDMMCQG